MTDFCSEAALIWARANAVGLTPGEFASGVAEVFVETTRQLAETAHRLAETERRLISEAAAK